MATAYNVLANGGLKIEPVTVLKVTDEKGQVIEQYRPEVPKQVVRAAGFAPDAAGKTGTTNDLRDAWFAGYTPDLLCVVWVGYDDNTPTGLSGSRAALPIWIEFMKGARAGRETRPFDVPAEGIVFVEIDKETGLLASSGAVHRQVP